MTLVFFILVGTWVSFTRTSLPMQSNVTSVTDASAVYCQTLTNAGASSTETEVGSAKPLAVTSSLQPVQAFSTSHLVTNRAYMASKLTSDYVSEMSVEKPSEMHIGSIVHSKAQCNHMHNMTLQSKGIAGDDVASYTSEYVQFIRCSDSNSHSASTSELETLRSDESARLGTCSSFPTLTKNGDVLYWEIKDDHCRNCADVVPPASGYSVGAHEDIVIERDKLLQRVSRLTIEKQEMVYKLREFVETNAKLHADLERFRAAIVELQNKLQELESTLERERHEKVLMSNRLVEQTSYRTLNYNKKEQSSNNSWQRTLEGAVINAGEVGSAGSSPSSSGVLAELRQAVHLALEQQQQLETLRVVIEKQNKSISKLSQRDASLGLELRQTNIQDMHAPSDDSCTTSADVAAAVVTPSASATAAVPLIATMSTAVHTQHSPSVSSRRAAFGTLFSTHLPSSPSKPTTQHSPPTRRIDTPATRPMSHTAPAQPLVRPEPELAAAAVAKQSHLESLPSGFEMTTACPICQIPIPFNAKSSDAFAHHVDKCISRVTREGPSATASVHDRTCPVCNIVCPTDKFSQSEFERHVEDHFDDVTSQFVQLL